MKHTFSKYKERTGSVRKNVNTMYLMEVQLLELLPAASFISDESGTLLNYNNKAAELWGETPPKGQTDARLAGSLKLYYPNGSLVKKEDSPVAATLNDGKPRYDMELIVERADGSRRCVEWSCLPVHEGNENIVGVICHLQEVMEVSENKGHAAEGQFGGADRYQAAGIENKYKDFIHSLPTPLYTTDEQGHITLYNKAAAALWGRSPRIGTDLWCGSHKMQHADGRDLPLDESPMAICLKEQRPVYGEEMRLVRPDGSIRNVLPHPQPLFDKNGRFTGAINMLIDITDQKNTEKALRQSEKNFRELAIELERIVDEKTRDLTEKNEELKKSEERYHKMVEEVEDYAIILLDKNGIVQNWNRGAEKIKGYKEEDIVGKSFSTFYLPEDREKQLPQQILKEARSKGKAVYEGWRLRKDGTRFWGSIVITALHDDHNEIIGFSKVTRDLTERKLAEDKMKEYTSQLEFQNKELEQFTYAASHDMKEPLRKIHLYNTAIVENAGDRLDEKSREFLNRSVNAARRMTNLIDDLLTYSRTTANVDSLEKVDLNHTLEEIRLMHRDELEESQVTLVAANLPVITAIPFQMTQLFSNIIGNSIKYKHPDRNLKVEIRNTEVRGSEIKQEGALAYRIYHKISFIDNGLGFDQQHAERIFNIFQRLHNNAGSQGSGIGLAICKRIVQNHHGFITAAGKPGEGARFDIYMPA